MAFRPLGVASLGTLLREAGTVAGNVHVPRRCFVCPTEHVAKITAGRRDDDEEVHDDRAPNNATKTFWPEFDGLVAHCSTNGVDSEPRRLGLRFDVIEQILFGVGFPRRCERNSRIEGVDAGDLERGTVCRWLERKASGSGGRTRVDLLGYRLGVGKAEGALLHNGALDYCALDYCALDHAHVGRHLEGRIVWNCCGHCCLVAVFSCCCCLVAVVFLLLCPTCTCTHSCPC